ncbi:MAG: FtsX-like permease family protein [Ignavibacteria bacterium]|nr:FtsX-like permease family protein [Ignavibacteria bacterium]
MKVFLYNFLIASEAILQNKLRAVLTSLGIICGVASVIAMLAIGKGAEQEILEKMRLLGTNNIIIKPLDLNKKSEASEESSDTKKSEKNKYTPGLNLNDASSIEDLPNVEAVSPEPVIETLALREGVKYNINLVGIKADYFKTNSFNIKSGNNFLSKNIELAEPVCIIGAAVRTKLFPTEDPLGKSIKCGHLWLKVIGVLEEKNISKENLQNLGIRNYNFEVYAPISTILLRFKNRSLITKQSLATGASNGEDEESNKDINLNQLDKIVVSVDKSENVTVISEIIDRMLFRRHNEVRDFEIIVPELLLQQEQRTKQVFNFVLGAIASISLIVGGIGIMNIMLASVLERTKEIGVRLAVGAKQNDVLLQFLSEAVAISLTGGILGIVLGIVASVIIESSTGIKTIVSPFAVLISFFVSISVGLIFGIMPANRASKQHPIDLLRYE